MRLSRFGLLALGLMLAAPVAAAQISSEGGPIYVDSESSEARELERTILLQGNVDIQQGTARLRADRVTIQFAPRAAGSSGSGAVSGFGEVQTLTADGNVFYITPDLKAKGDKGVYNRSSDTITITGKVALLRDKDVAEGQTLTYVVGKRITTLDGGSGRTRMRIDPSSKPAGNTNR
jgi:lipopolysaccharide export system protein LptA